MKRTILEHPAPNVSRGYLYALLAAVCGGTYPTLSKLALPQTGPVALSGLAFLISGLVLVPYRPRVLPSSKSIRWVILFGLLGAAAAPVIYQFGLNASTAVNASLLSNGEALFTTIIAFAAFGERLPRKQLARGLLIVAGIVVVTTNFDLAHIQFFVGLAGNLLILGATFLWSIENNVIIPAARKFGGAFVTKYRNLIGGALVTAIFFGAGGAVSLGFAGFAYVVLAGVTLAGTSYFAIVALADIGAIRAILVFSTTTIFGAAFALIVLQEQITPVQVIGGALILLGVYLLQRAERKAPNPSGRV